MNPYLENNFLVRLMEEMEEEEEEFELARHMLNRRRLHATSVVMVVRFQGVLGFIVIT
jgi:hypothetical protein